jgi:epoxyqueuosine reductase
MNKGFSAGSRREFIKVAGRIAALMCLASTRLFPLRKSSQAQVPDGIPHFRWRSVSLRHLPEMQEWMARLDWAGRLSRDKTWRKYIDAFAYGPPPAAQGARSLIIMATPLRISRIVFQIRGSSRTVRIPSGYVDDGQALADYRDMLCQNGIVPRGSRLEPARLPLKQLAVRSGLAAYGRNNITYVDGYGSFHQLLAFYSEQALEDHWRPLQLLRDCKGCSICLQACPTGAIRRNDFIIDPGRCLTLFNELPDPIPGWIPASAHNALIGCLRCQLTCPGNKEVIGEQWDLGVVSEAETAALLGNSIDARTGEALKARFRRIDGGDNLPYLARNLRLVLGATAAGKP